MVSGKQVYRGPSRRGRITPFSPGKTLANFRMSFRKTDGPVLITRRRWKLDFYGVVVMVTVELGGQFTVRWDEALRLPGRHATLKPGKCNLYNYPEVHLQGYPTGWPTPLSTDEGLILHALLLALARDEGDACLEAPDDPSVAFLDALDDFGATACLGLLVANTDAAIVLFVAICRAKPATMVAPHGPGPFVGENALHVLMANRREAAALELLPLACDTLDRPTLKKLFYSQAEGPFFSSAPMVFYGGTPVAYAVAFSLPMVITAMLKCAQEHPQKMNGLINLDDPRHACVLTGFLPLHVAVANGLIDMYDFLIDLAGMPREDQLLLHPFRADPNIPARRGRSNPEYCNLTPVQLATKLGDRRMFQHCLRRCAIKKWKWGPVTSFELDLVTVDSCGSSGNDVMELIGRLDARPATQHMLLHDFMQGFIHELFLDKWKRYARHWYWCMRALDVAYYIILVVFTMHLKYTILSPTLCKLLPSLVLVVGFAILIEQARACYLFFHNFRGRPEFSNKKVDTHVAPDTSTQGERPAPIRVPSESATDDEVTVSAGATTTMRSFARSPTVSATVGELADAASKAFHHASNPLRFWDALKPTLQWARSHHMLTKLIGQLAVTIACVQILCSPDPLSATQSAVAAARVTLGVGSDEDLDHGGYGDFVWDFGDKGSGSPPAPPSPPDKPAPPPPPFNWDAELTLRKWSGASFDDLVKASQDPYESELLMELLMENGYTEYVQVCVLLAVGVFCWTLAFWNVIFVPSQHLGILSRAVVSMVMTDVSSWLILLAFSLCTFGLCVFICYPMQIGTPPDGIGLVDKFDHPLSSLQAILELALLGLEFEVNLSELKQNGKVELIDLFTEGRTVERVDALFFLMAYVAYMIIALILLLNLLIAMMSTTYEQIKEQSVLKWRVDFARLVLKIELECAWLTRRSWRPYGPLWDLHAGQRTADGRYLFSFKHVEKNVEGIEMAGGSAVFDDLRSLGNMHAFSISAEEAQPPEPPAGSPRPPAASREVSPASAEVRRRSASFAAPLEAAAPPAEATDRTAVQLLAPGASGEALESAVPRW